MAMEREQILLESKIAKARKSLGVSPNQPNPYGLEWQIKQWRFEIHLRLGHVEKNLWTVTKK